MTARILSSLRFRAAAASILLIGGAFCAFGLLVGASVSDFRRSIPFALAVTVVAGAALGVVIGAIVLRPVRRIIRSAQSIASGDLRQRITPRPSGEMGELADAFDQMGGSLEGLITAASQERNRLQAALNSSIDAVIAIDSDGRVTFANLAAERLFTPAQGQLIGNPLVWVLQDEHLLEAVRTAGKDGLSETFAIERPGKQHLQVMTTPILGGGDWASLAVFHDLTDVKRTEQVRRDFVANVSHELRTPLAAVKSVIETLQSGALNDEQVAQDFLSRADTEVDRLVQMVEELLELSRIESGEVPFTREPVDVGATLARAVERLKPQAERKTITLGLDVAAGLPAVVGDAERLERAALNLIHNAIKFTPQGGSVQVRVGSADGAVTVTVSDTGVGIAREDLPRIFERFYKVDRARQAGGTGLGLAVAKHTIEAHGGSINARSELGHGATFELSIPARPQAHTTRC